MKRLFPIIILLLSLLACSDDDGHGNTGYITMPVNISMLHTSEGSRAPGDPGVWTDYALPSRVYVYALVYDGENETGNCSFVSLNGADATGKYALDPDAWKVDAQTKGLYHYDEHLSITLPEHSKSGRVYVAAADRDIPGITIPIDLTRVKDITYQLPAENCSEFMKNLYSTPYNLVYAYDEERGQFTGSPLPPSEENKRDKRYYGTISGVGTVYPHVHVVLYHVAAQLDIKWNVAEAVRKDNAVTYLQVENVPKTAYLFRPTENPKPTGSNCLQYNLINYTSLNDAMGTAWSGRKVVFLPQMYETVGATTYYPLDVTIGVNGDAIGTGQGEKEGYLVNHQETYTPDAVFTSWIAVNLNIEKKITY